MLQITTSGELTIIQVPNGDRWTFVEGEAQEFIERWFTAWKEVYYG